MDKKREDPGFPEGEAGRKMLDRMNKSHAPLRDWGFPHLAWHDTMHILDAGCGGGAAIKELLNYSKNSIVEGVDYAEESVAQAKKYNQEELGKRVFIRQGDVGALPYEDDCFDVITAVETVYFWPDLLKAMKEMHRVLKEGGSFMILCEGSDPDHNDWPEIPTPMRIYRPEELVTYLAQAGFKSASYDKGPGQYICVIGQK
jgi:ubiquinone/menaquinone biosynthesis C-methylase UbiE